VLLHRVAHSTARSFLDRLADNLEESASHSVRPTWI
jgi:hypothetical protein